MTEAELVHHIAGRMRIRVSSAKGDAEQLEHIRGSLTKLPGVLGVAINPGIGTLIIHYDPALFSEVIQRITEHASQADLFILRPPDQENDRPHVSQVDRSLDQFFLNANRIVETATGHAINLKELFPFGIILYALLFMDKAVGASQWLSWLQFAISSYLELHESEPIARVGESVEALRAELQALREELRQHFERPPGT